MANPAASQPANSAVTCTDMEGIFTLWDKLASGSPLPNNVIDTNPWTYKPQNLPEGVLFLINSKENIDVEQGLWKISEEACEVYSNFNIIGWRTTLEYYERQVTQVLKTNYVMQLFSATQKRLSDDNENKEAISLCRVFLVPSQEMHQNVSRAAVDTETRNNMTQPFPPDASSCIRIGSSNNREVNQHHEIEVPESAERIPALEIAFSPSDGFLELDDLGDPASPSSSSENSSAISVSSDQHFDAMLLEDLDDPIVEQNDANRRLHVSASKKSDEVVMVPATLESLVSVEGSNSDNEEIFKTAGSAPVSASGSKDPKKKVKDNARWDQRDEGSSSSRKPSTSPSSRMKKLRKKYLCFMPF